MKILKIATKVFVTFLTIFGLSISPVVTQEVNACEGCGEKTVAFIAGQNIDAGSVRLYDDGNNIYVEITTTDGWTMSKIHVDVALTLDDIGGAPGRFYSGEIDVNDVTTYTYTVPMKVFDGRVNAEYLFSIQADVHKDGVGSETAYAQGHPTNTNGWQMYLDYKPCTLTYPVHGAFTKYFEKDSYYPDALANQAYAGTAFNLYDASHTLLTHFHLHADGTLDTDGYKVPVGTYYLKEAYTTNDYYRNNTEMMVTVTPEYTTITPNKVTNYLVRKDITITKYDSVTNQTLPGVTFDLYYVYNSTETYITSLVTNEQGVVTFEDYPNGTYKVVESATLPDYVLNPNPQYVTIKGYDKYLSFYNTHIESDYGTFTLYKYDEHNHSLDGGLFKVTSTSNPDMTPITFTTTSGMYTMALPYGDYTYEEVSAPSGYINIHQTPVAFTIDGEQENIEVQLTNPTSNLYRISELPFLKVMEQSLFTNAYQNVRYSIYAVEDITYIDDHNQSQTIPKGTKLGEYGLTSLGENNYALALPEGTKYVAGMYELVETTTDVNYVLDTNHYTFEIDENAHVSWSNYDEATLTVTNLLKRFDVTIHKVDAVSGKVIANVEFTLYDANKVAMPNYVSTTDANGMLVFKNLPNGTYYIKESKAPAGYQLNPTYYEVIVNNGNATITIKDQPIPVAIIPTNANSNLFGFLAMGTFALAGALYVMTRRKRQ